MAQRVRQRREVSINSVRFPLGGDGRVHQSVSSQYPRKQVFGDIDKDSNPVTSVIVWDDWTDGIGLYSTNGKEGMNRALFSRCETRFKGHLTLPKVLTTAADPSVSGTILEINERAGVLHCALNGGRDAWVYTPASGVQAGSWADVSHTFPAVVTDSLNFTLGGTEYVAFAHTGGYSYTASTSYTDDTTYAIRLAFWDDRLWGIDNTGQLWFSTAIGVETNDAKLSLPAGYVNELFTGPDAMGEDILYASTNVGLYAHDAANSRFVKTKVSFPQDNTAKHGAATWNGEIYVAVGDMTVWRYNPVAGTIRSVGMDLDAGLQSGTSTDVGDIVRLVPVHSGVIAQVNGASADGAWEYNGTGWHFMVFPVGSVGTLHASDAGGFYRLYLNDGVLLKFRVLDVGHVNPDVATIVYDTTAVRLFHITPWFNAGQNEIDKLAIRMRLDCTGMTSNETVKVEYGIDYGTSFYADEDYIFTITGNGVTTRTFPEIVNNNSEAGAAFRAIRFKLTLNQSTSTTVTPNVKSLSLEWRRKIPTRYRGSMVIDHTRRYGGRSAKELKAALITAVELSTMAEVTWVDDGGNTQNYFCDVSLEEDSGESGRKETGMTKITVVEN
jgi:hypothetical protein